jgi:serine/threonine protein kinase
VNPERFARVKEVLLTALASPPSERDAYLGKACEGDAALLAEVEALLAQHGRMAPEIRTGALAGLAAHALASAGDGEVRVRLPDRIGPYRVLGILGEGGMGVVYHAEQEEPVRREVALKLMRSAVDSSATLARFETERQVLARMDHPNIARLLDAAATRDGHPYFVMELVRGIRITDYCRERSVGGRGRLRLFLDVCRAVRHAHRCGVIHRDLKPSNILVTEAHGEPVPKVIDFSIAKALGDDGFGTEARTRTGQIVGTLEYMSPEQARGVVHALDTRADVYALGVILYELLVDRLPHELADQPLHEAVRRIVDEPPRPLRRGTTTATGRVDAELDTVVRKCLEKDPERRYDSAAELCEDLERYLASRPILARPPSTLYALRKLVWRHRVAFGFMALTFVFLIGYGITVSIQLGVQRRERAKAESAAAEARTSAARAERINTFMQSLFTSASPNSLGRNVSVREVLDRAGEQLESSLEDEPEARANAYATLAQTYGQLGDLKAARRHAEKALELHRALHPGDHETVAHDLVRLEEILALGAGTQKEAYRLGQEGIAMWRHLAPGPRPEVADAMANFAWRLRDQMPRAEREKTAREAVAIWDALGDPGDWRAAGNQHLLALVLWKNGKLEEAVARSRRAVEILDRVLGPDDPRTIDARGDLGAMLMDLPGQDEAALTMIRDTLAKHRAGIGPDHILTACAERNLGLWMVRHYRFEEARLHFAEGRRINRQAYGPINAELAVAAHNLALIPHVRGDYAAAEAGYREMMFQYDRAGIPPPAPFALDYALLQHTVGRDAESRAHLQEAIQREKREGPEVTRTLARLMIALGCVLTDSGQLAEADPYVAAVRKSLPEIEDEEGCTAPLSAVVLARLRALQGRAKESEPLFHEASDRLSYCVPRAPAEWGHLLPVTAAFLESRGNLPEAARYRDALARLSRIVRGDVPDWWKEGAGA